MRAMVINSYGPPEVLQLSNVADPEPGPKKILIEVRAAGVNAIDWKIRKGNFRLITGRRFPRILGADIAGIVKKTGNKVIGFKPGDEVMAMVNILAGKGGDAELAVADVKHTCSKPANLTFIEAAAVPGSAVTALQVLQHKGHLKEGSNLLINGASGGVGTYAVQIAKILGSRITAVCSGRNKDLVASLGAERVIDYTRADFTRQDQAYDVIFDAVGNLHFIACGRVLSAGGTFITIVPDVAKILFSLFTAILPGKKCCFVSVMPKKDDLLWLKKKIEEQRVRVVLDKTYSLEDAAKAHAYMEKGHARGKVVLTL